MNLGTILLIVLILILIGAIPTWPHSRGWGYGPSGGLRLVLMVLFYCLWEKYKGLPGIRVASDSKCKRHPTEPVGFTNRNEKSVARGWVLTILAGNNTIAQAKWRNTG